MQAAGLDDPWSLALESFSASWRLDHQEATRLARAAASALPQDPREDPEAAALSYAVLALAAAGTGISGTWSHTAPGHCASGDPIVDAISLLPLLEAERDSTRFVRYALAEAALGCARVRLAASVLGDPSPLADELAGHPFEAVMCVLASRIASFSGQIDEARTRLQRIPAGSPPQIELLVSATRSLIEGNASDPAEVRAIASRVEAMGRTRDDRIGFGIALLCAYGLIAQGGVDRAVALATRPGWTRTMIVDRAIVCELLVNAASRRDDVAAARAWLAHSEGFEGDPIADSTLARIASRIRLLEGNTGAALDAAEESIRRANLEGRVIEAAEGEILAARARIAGGNTGEATRRLEAAVAVARPAGYIAVRRSARRELHGTGRRLRPTSGSGSAELSPREIEVLDLLLQGLPNADIATRLHISPHTTRIHVSRILAAHGASSRLELATRLLSESDGPRPAYASITRLTPRQRTVVALAATGARNVDIAGRLGIAVRTVEKHLTDAMHRIGATTRVGLIMQAAAEGRNTQSE